MKKIIFIEGLPGSGKTTMAKKLSDYLHDTGEKSVFYREGDLHPVDLAWIAILSKEELDHLVNRYPTLKDAILNNIKQFKDKYHLAYTQVKINQETKDFFDYCLKYEIYQAEDYNHFLQKHLVLWEEFLKEKRQDDFIYVFECIFLQNHINELLLKYDMTLEAINEYFSRFQEILKSIDVQLIYIKQNDVDDTLKRITEERRTNDKTLYEDWIDHVIEYFEGSRYGKSKGYIGYDGALRYFKNRQDIELKVVDNLEFDTHVIPLDKDYGLVFSEIVKSISLN